jgi:hypothetical protein
MNTDLHRIGFNNGGENNYTYTVDGVTGGLYGIWNCGKSLKESWDKMDSEMLR